MSELLKTVITIFVFLFVARIIWYHIDFNFCATCTDIIMRYNEFKQIYTDDPTHFILDRFKGNGANVIYDGDNGTYHIYFKHIFDWWRVKLLMFKADSEGNNAVRSAYRAKMYADIEERNKNKAG